MAETNTNSTVSISLMLMKANLEHKVPVANARIAIKLCRVTFMPTLPADRALACAIRLTNLNNGRSYERDYVLSYSPIDQAYHFPPAMHQKSITELMDILGIACESERNRTGSELTHCLRRWCERTLFVYRARWFDGWVVAQKMLPDDIIANELGVVMNNVSIRTDDAGEIVRTTDVWPPEILESLPMPELDLFNSRSNDMSLEKSNILVQVPYAEREKAKEMGLVWSRKDQSWMIPESMDLQAVKDVLKTYRTQTPEEAIEFAKSQRKSDEYKAQREVKEEEAREKVSTVETKETVNEEDIQVVKDYLETHIPPYARLYLEAKRFTSEERETLKKGKAIYDVENKRWCVDRRLPNRAFDKYIPDYIIVPVEEKEDVKAMGAKWDFVQRSWVVPKDNHEEALKAYPRLKDMAVRQYLAVPKQDEAKVKELGAVMDPIAKAFFVPKESDVKDFEPWRIDNLSPVVSRPRVTAADKQIWQERQAKRERQEEQTQEKTQTRGRSRKVSR